VTGTVRKRRRFTGGRWLVTWIVDLPNRGDRSNKTFRTEAEAYAHLHNAQGQVKTGTYVADSASVDIAYVCDRG
jgi:hypothetical protein